jgi:aryl-alcohol dehydrogenase-like predicted oxidoreductase
MDREPHASGYDQLDFDDYERAAPFRELANQWSESAASLAHRYALSVAKVSSVILGVKNRNELQECLDSEQKGRLTAGQIEEIEKVLIL